VAGTGAVYFYSMVSSISGASSWSMMASFISPSTYFTNSYAVMLNKPNHYGSNFGFSTSLYNNYAIVGAPQYCKTLILLLENTFK
jgi:hypothetical protein